MPRSDDNPIEVVLIEDHAVVRAGIRLLLGSQPGLKVVGEAGNRKEALALVARQQPDIILLDLMLGEESGLELLPELTASCKAHVIVLTGMTEADIHRRVVSLGARGLVFKEQATEVLLQAIAKVAAGEVCFDPAMMARWLATPPKSSEDQDLEAAKIVLLSEREREVLVLVCEGLKNHQIGARLYISETTVRHHLTSIFQKLQVADRLELLIYAFRHRLCQVPSPQ